MADREKDGEDRNTKTCIFQEGKKKVFDEKKNIFHNYLRAIMVKKKKKIADTIFNLEFCKILHELLLSLPYSFSF